MIFSFDESASVAAAATAAEVDLNMSPRRQYRLAATAAAGVWFRITTPGGTAAAVNGAGSHYLAAGEAVPVAAISTRTRVSVIREASTDGRVCLSEIIPVVAPG